MREGTAIELGDVLQQLYDERERVERTISALELLLFEGDNASPPRKNGRGRKSMGLEERREVAERMRRYWAARKGTEAAASGK